MSLLRCNTSISIHRTVSNSRGISLIDMLIALFVTVLGSLAVFSLIVTSTGANKRAADQVVAANAARQEVEILRSMDSYLFSNRTNAPLIGSIPQLNNLASSSGTLTISDYPSLTGIKLVTVTISWMTPNSNETRTLSMSTLIGKGGLRT